MTDHPNETLSADDRLDARLRRAGEVWRAANDTPAAVRPRTADDAHAPAQPVMAPPVPRLRRHAGLLVSAAVVAAALVVGGGLALHGSSHRASPTDGAGPALVGTVWRLTGYGSAPDVTSDGTFYLGTDGTLVADDGCTLVVAAADAADGTLRLSRIDVRERSCTDQTPPALAAPGVDILRADPAYSVDGADLTLTASGTPAMHFTAVPGAVPPSADVPTFTDTEWQLEHVRDPSGQEQPVSENLRLRVTNTKLVADDGVNALNANVTERGGGVAVSDVAVGGTGSIDPQPTATVIDDVLSGPKFEERVDASSLTISAEGKGTLTYRWVPKGGSASEPSSLTGRTWVLQTVVGAAATGNAFLRIDATGALTGSDGCRDFSGHAAVSAGWMALTGVPQSTPSSCADQATTIDSFLQNDVLWTVRDGRLVVWDGGAQSFALVYGEPNVGPASSIPAALVGPTWTSGAIEVFQFPKGAALVTDRATRVADTIAFARDGQYRLATRCGTDRGLAVFRGRRLTFAGPHHPAYHRCPFPGQGINTQEARIADVLSGTVIWSAGRGRLSLTKGNVTIVLTS